MANSTTEQVQVPESIQVQASRWDKPYVYINQTQYFCDGEHVYLDFRTILPDLSKIPSLAHGTDIQISDNISEIPPTVRVMLTAQGALQLRDLLNINLPPVSPAQTNES